MLAKATSKRRPGREWAKVLLVGDRASVRGLAGNDGRVVAASLCCRVLETIAYPRTVPFKTAWSCGGMPELEPGSGEGQNQIKEQMCNERDGRPIKTSGCKKAGRPWTMMLIAYGRCTPEGHAGSARNMLQLGVGLIRPLDHAVRNFCILNPCRFLSMK